MAYWTVIGTGIEGDLTGKMFSVTLDTETDKWMAGGPSVDKFFITKSGVFKYVGIPENGTQLVKSGPVEVAFITALNRSSAVGQTGRGRASETGANFSWKLDSK
ncbi:conserved hypothetical protein [Methylocella tundrae]|uniref:Uncharacterized protein n=1 Tax=Methylocella tundrae TaxID=227605 RepID=A0A8B6M8K9_METTU|nr:hypothetical protein [Methylocella tundrae]VTZ27856.1 conserved hypothetical protein [Methylocella tundrae]VTZ51357.1 conserved hypothetical protein [Methylocella tundrae]